LPKCQRARRKIEQLKQQLDNEVAEVYGLREEVAMIQNALKVIGGEIQEKGRLSPEEKEVESRSKG